MRLRANALQTGELGLEPASLKHGPQDFLLFLANRHGSFFRSANSD